MPAIVVRNEIRFLLNGEAVALSEVGAEDTLLDFLRLRRALTGTKEGCAEGDCGACTVLVGRLAGENLIYEGVDACIRFMGSLDGCHVVTVEHLRGEGGRLHPVQQAMVDHHGSQCGFCTPGVVMSLYALWMRSPRPTDREIEKSLQGNLCRCTGYESIMRAARAITDHGSPATDPLAAERDQVRARLLSWRDGARVEIGSGEARFTIPANVDDLAALLETEPETTIVAGSTDVGLWVTKGMRPIAPAVFIGGLDELRAVSERDNVLTIGAGVTYTEAFNALAQRIPALASLIDRIGGDQIRNMGTIGGNLANGSPIGDMAPPLIALGATLVLRKGSKRRRIALEDFFIAYGKQDRLPGEFVEAVEAPLPDPAGLFAIHKVSKRHDEDITSVLGAFNLTLDQERRVRSARIAYGGMAATPERARAVEATLKGKIWSRRLVEDTLDAYGRDFAPISDMRASAEYRMLVARNLLLRVFLETSGTTGLLRVSRSEAA